MTVKLPLLILISVLAVILLYLNRNTKNKRTYTYNKKTFLLTKAEHEFYDVLIQTVGHEYYIFPQIHLDTLADFKIKGQNWHAAHRHIDEKSVDFVLCDKAYISPKLAIELDEKSHDEPNRQLRDQQVDEILHEINLPLLRIRNHGSFNPAEIAEQIKAALTSPSV